MEIEMMTSKGRTERKEVKFIEVFVDGCRFRLTNRMGALEINGDHGLSVQPVVSNVIEIKGKQWRY